MIAKNSKQKQIDIDRVSIADYPTRRINSLAEKTNDIQKVSLCRIQTPPVLSREKTRNLPQYRNAMYEGEWEKKSLDQRCVGRHVTQMTLCYLDAVMICSTSVSLHLRGTMAPVTVVHPGCLLAIFAAVFRATTPATLGKLPLELLPFPALVIRTLPDTTA